MTESEKREKIFKKVRIIGLIICLTPLFCMFGFPFYLYYYNSAMPYEQCVNIICCMFIIEIFMVFVGEVILPLGAFIYMVLRDEKRRKK